MFLKRLINRFKLTNSPNKHLNIFDSIFEKSSVVNLVIEANSGKIVHFNDAALKFYGYTKEEFSNMNYSDLDLAFIPIDSVNYLTNKYPDYNYKSNHKIKFGELKRVEVFFTVFTHNCKKLIHALVVDITEKIKTENEFIAKMKRDKELLSYIPYVAFEINNKGIIIDFYKGAFNKKTKTKEFYVGKKIIDVIDLDEYSLTRAINDILVNGSKTHEFNFIKFSEFSKNVHVEVKPTDNYNILVLVMENYTFAHENDNDYI